MGMPVLWLGAACRSANMLALVLLAGVGTPDSLAPSCMAAQRDGGGGCLGELLAGIGVGWRAEGTLPAQGPLEEGCWGRIGHC